jgi:hypothetical protein
MSLFPKIVITPVNTYEQMCQGEDERMAILESSVRDPIGYKLRLLQDLVEDPEAVVSSYLKLTGGTDEKVNAIASDRVKIAQSLMLDLSLPLGVKNFDSRVLEILRMITPETIRKMACAYQLIIKTTNSMPLAAWKAKVSTHLGDMGPNLVSKWNQESVILGNCKNSNDIVSLLIKGRVIPWIEFNPIEEEDTPSFDKQNSRLTYLKTVLLTASLHIYILLDKKD